MHYSNYISGREAGRCIRDGVACITVTPTALKQTNSKTLEALSKNGVTVEEVRSAGRPRKLSEASIKKLITIRHSGVSFYKISNLMHIPKSTAFDYCKRHAGATPGEREIKDVSISESHKIFAKLLKRDLDDEVNDLAKKGLKARDLEKIEAILKEIEIILYC